MKTISIIGSSGSIGTQALEIIRARPDEFQVLALAAGSKLELLVDQIKEFKPQYVSILDGESQKYLQELFPQIQVLGSIEEIAQLKVDIFLSAVVGIAGLKANLEALKHAKRVAIANKETLVSAKHLVKEASLKYSSELIPVDSEHVAIHQCLGGVDKVNGVNKVNEVNGEGRKVKEILLTSSGGPFRNLALEDFKNISLEQALKHPKWTMGPKITVDSSTLMNKGLELIEVNSLFDIDYDQIQIVIHPQSIVHSAVTFVDGNTIAQMSMPDMQVSIQYALDYPERKTLKLKNDFDIFAASPLEFEKPDLEKFPALDLAYAAGRKAHSYPTVLNSANEAAVKLFLENKIHYLDIVKLINKELEQHQIIKNPSIDDILELDKEIRIRIQSFSLSLL